jgi:hypothetical protein
LLYLKVRLGVTLDRLPARADSGGEDLEILQRRGVSRLRRKLCCAPDPSLKRIWIIAAASNDICLAFLLRPSQTDPRSDHVRCYQADIAVELGVITVQYLSVIYLLSSWVPFLALSGPWWEHAAVIDGLEDDPLRIKMAAWLKSNL